MSEEVVSNLVEEQQLSSIIPVVMMVHSSVGYPPILNKSRRPLRPLLTV
jgi:hypothetical protein